MPTHIVGDFDSAGETEYEYFQKNTDVPIKRLNPVKDYTDTDVALRLALELGAEEITILGGTGHASTIPLPMYGSCLALQKGVRAYLLDEHNKMWLTDHAVSIKRGTVRQISFFVCHGRCSERSDAAGCFLSA